MGQYQQWLHYREIEHDLQAQLETLERELAQLQERSLEHNEQQQATSLQADNPILQALAINLKEQEQASPISTIDTTPLPPSLPETLPHEPEAVLHSSMGLLPEDMGTFFDQHAQTEPQLEVPRWFRNLTDASSVNGPIDQETIRTNRLVQRWLERWGRQSSSQPNARENQHE
jgi:hypothetical protein